MDDITRKEAIEIIKGMQTDNFNHEPEEIVEALDMAIKALEQEPCEDAISRADAEALFRNARSKLNPSDYKTADEFNTRDLMLLNAEQFIHLLLSVKLQEPKTGHWIMSDDGLYRPICNKCGAHPWKGYIPTVEEATEVFKYCPNCGAKMESEG